MTPWVYETYLNAGWMSGVSVAESHWAGSCTADGFISGVSRTGGYADCWYGGRCFEIIDRFEIIDDSF